MPRQLLALSERYYRRLLYSCACLLSAAIVCAILFLGYSAFSQFRERQIGTFTSKREQIKSEVDRLTARVVQFAEMYARLQHLYKRELLTLEGYTGNVGGGQITRSPENLTVVPFSLLVRSDTAADRLRLASLLLLLRQASALPMFNPAEPGVTLDGFIYTADAGFLAVSPPLEGAELALVRQQGIARFISALGAPVNAAFAAERERAARAQGSTGQRVLWMSPALSAPLVRNAVTRLAVRIQLDKGDEATAVFSVPASQFRQFFMKNEDTPGLFVFEGQGSVQLLSQPDDQVDPGLMQHIQEHVRREMDPHDHVGHFHDDGSFFIAQTIEGPDWVVVYTFTWRDVLAGLQGNFITGAFWGLFSLLFVWAATLYFDRCVIGPLQKKALAMVESRQFSQTIIDTLPVGIAVYAPGSGEVLLRNAVAAQMLEQSALPSAGFYAQILTAVRVGDDLRQAMIEAELPLRDGGVSHLGAVWSRTRFSGQDVLLLGMIDLNMQKAHEALMRDARSMADRANQAKSMFLAQVSHEIRTPLHGAIGHLELLTREDLSAPQRQRIELIRHAFDMLMSLVNDILDITKIESQSITLASEQLQVNELLEECAQLFAPLALDKGLQFRCLPDVALERPLRGDPRRLMQILQNLVGNAVKFTSTGSITLSTRLLRVAEGVSVVRFEVADTGIGVSSGARQRIFKSLQQADDSISQRFGGTGLGLSLCRRLAELMGGDITLTSEPGKGSVFGAEIVLQTLPQADLQHAAPLRGRQVALHAGEASTAAMLRAYLKHWGAEPVEPESAGLTTIHLVAPDSVEAFVAAPVSVSKTAVLIRADVVRHSSSVTHWRQVSAFDRHAWRMALSQQDGMIVPPWRGRPQAVQLPVAPDMLDVLVVEDDYVNLTLIQQQLQALGCQRLRLARDGLDALAQWQAQRADLLITDLDMPGLDGVALARRVRQEHAQACIIATTAAGPDSLAHLPSGLFDALLYKPGSLQQMQELLSRFGRPAAPVQDQGDPLQKVLLEAFRHSWPQERDKLQQVLQRGDGERAARILHRLQGGLLAMGREHLAERSQMLQTALADGEPDAMQAILQWIAVVDAEI
ncbi:ATP-binding protein [Herbaspirillum sp. VT-16-41]|uniref:hybrid sensor histidine kinase/response regulator n=1 Tax=Herbaspirillum sp. VT-16-41 TaxID=1953765 RepID=UPI0009809F72|nr:ATP-binding protein [Herbaspirillum sp. VT-16-41]ONN67635.1 hybrid sensor histidine kinase/response regulator [Herbaspirillum sp. VT-16-41]